MWSEEYTKSQAEIERKRNGFRLHPWNCFVLVCLKKSGESSIKKLYARRQLEYGEHTKGYWTNDRLIKQMEDAVKLFEIINGYLLL